MSAIESDERAIVTRDEALCGKLKLYFTGKPCKRGHVAERRVDNYTCVVCLEESARHFKRANPEHIRSYASRHYERNRDTINDQRKKDYAANPEKMREAGRRYAAAHREEAKARAKAHREANRDKVLAGKKRHYEENKEKYQRLRRLNYDANREKYLEDKREYYQANRDELVLKMKEYRRRNPERIRAIHHATMAKRRAVEGRFTRDDVRRLMILQKGRCAYCRINIRRHFHIDHVVALAKGGTNWPNNLQLTCVSCNLRKNAKHPEDFARELGLLL